jgi:pilus assembly protein Flp/PilA
MRRLNTNLILRRFLSAQEGTTAIEYAIIASGVAGVLIATVTTLGGSVSALFTSLTAVLH